MSLIKDKISKEYSLEDFIDDNPSIRRVCGYMDKSINGRLNEIINR